MSGLGRGLGRGLALTPEVRQAVADALHSIHQLAAVFDDVAAEYAAPPDGGGDGGGGEEEDVLEDEGFVAPTARLSLAGANAFCARVHLEMLTAIDGVLPEAAAVVRPLLDAAQSDNLCELRAGGKRAFSFSWLVNNPIEGLRVATEVLTRQ